jgi:hypothetical protein
MTVIAMTREIGSRGTEVAAGVAARLGLKVIRSDDVADSVAERLGIPASAFLRYMDGSASLLERWRSTAGNSFITRRRKSSTSRNRATS